MSTVFTWNIRVYYEDTDAGGVVYYANYLKFFERARTEWLRSAGVSRHEMETTFGAIFVVKSAAVDYHRAAKLDDELKLVFAIKKMGRASIQFHQEVWRGPELLTTGLVKIACVDTQTLRPCPIPEEVWSKLNA